MKAFSTDADCALRGLMACHAAVLLLIVLGEMIQVLWRVEQILRGLRIGRSAGVLQRGCRSFLGVGQTAHGLGEARVPLTGVLTTEGRDQPAERRRFATPGDRISASKTGPAAIICPRANGRSYGLCRWKNHLDKDLWQSLPSEKTGSIYVWMLMGSGVQAERVLKPRQKTTK